MPFETPFPPDCFAGTLSVSLHEHGGAPPSTIIRTDQFWAVNVHWVTTGLATGMICGNWQLHCYLEKNGSGHEYDLGDPDDHIIPMTPGPSPVHYFYPIDVPAGMIVSPGLYKLIVSLTYIEPTGSPGPMSAYDEDSMIQFYAPK